MAVKLWVRFSLVALVIAGCGGCESTHSDISVKNGQLFFGDNKLGIPACGGHSTLRDIPIPPPRSSHPTQPFGLSLVACGNDALHWHDTVTTPAQPRTFTIAFAQDECTGDDGKPISSTTPTSTESKIDRTVKAPAAGFFLACQYTLQVNNSDGTNDLYNPAHIIIIK